MTDVATTTEPPPRFHSDIAVPDAERLRVMFRAEEPGDRTYILKCWDMAWRDAPECRNLEPGRFWRMFQNLVVGGEGVLQRPDTRVLIGCSPEDRRWIWCYCVFTPGTEDADPTIHWMNVRPTLRDLDGGKRDIRRSKLATIMLAMGKDEESAVEGPGVVDRLTYTCKPGRETYLTNTNARQAREIEAALLEYGRKVGITAAYFPLARWLGGGK